MELKYFKPYEFKGNIDKMHPLLLERLDNLREYYGQPITLTSTYRSIHHPIEAAKPNGPGVHSRGLAVDIAAIGGTTMLELVKAAIKADFDRIGVNRNNNFIHIDVADVVEDRVKSFWHY